jgi:hypothetical protein
MKTKTRKHPKRANVNGGSRCLQRVVRSIGEPKPLDHCPAGLFLHEGHLGFKTEYSDQNGAEAYVVASGEYWWGGVYDRFTRGSLMVQPCEVIGPNEKLCREAGQNTL